MSSPPCCRARTHGALGIGKQRRQQLRVHIAGSGHHQSRPRHEIRTRPVVLDHGPEGVCAGRQNKTIDKFQPGLENTHLMDPRIEDQPLSGVCNDPAFTVNDINAESYEPPPPDVAREQGRTVDLDRKRHLDPAVRIAARKGPDQGAVNRSPRLTREQETARLSFHPTDSHGLEHHRRVVEHIGRKPGGLGATDGQKAQADTAEDLSMHRQLIRRPVLRLPDSHHVNYPHLRHRPVRFRGWRQNRNQQSRPSSRPRSVAFRPQLRVEW